MARKPLPPDDFAYGVSFERFSKLIRPRLSKIDAVLKISDINKIALIQVLWFFYSKSVDISAAMFDRVTLMNELRNAASLSRNLETSADKIWRSRDTAIFGFRSRFGGISVSSVDDRWPVYGTAAAVPVQPMHPSGVPFVDMLRQFSRDANREADKLYKARAGGPHPMAALDELLIGLVRFHRKVASREGPLTYANRKEQQDLFRFVAAVLDLLRQIEPHLRTKFKLPKNTENDRPLRDRLNNIMGAVLATDRVAHPLWFWEWINE